MNSLDFAAFKHNEDPSNALPKASATMPEMSNHPNRSKSNIKAGANPTPAQVRRAREEYAKLAAPHLGPDDINAARELAGDLVYASWRTWQNWEADAGTPEHRRMHPATWELLQAKLAAVRLLDKREISPALLRELGLYLPEVKEKA